MGKNLAVAALVGLEHLDAIAQAPASLVGRYQLDVAGGDVLELRPDGTATMAGDGTRWSARGNQLTVGPEVMNFVLQPERLLLNVGGTPMVWKRLGAREPLAPMQAAAAQAAHGDRTTNQGQWHLEHAAGGFPDRWPVVRQRRRRAMTNFCGQFGVLKDSLGRSCQP